MFVLAAYGVRHARKSYKRRKEERERQIDGHLDPIDSSTPLTQRGVEGKSDLAGATSALTPISTRHDSIFSQTTAAETSAADDIRHYQDFITKQSSLYLDNFGDPRKYERRLSEPVPNPTGTVQHVEDNSRREMSRVDTSRLVHHWLSEMRHETDPLSIAATRDRRPPDRASFPSARSTHRSTHRPRARQTISSGHRHSISNTRPVRSSSTTYATTPDQHHRWVQDSQIVTDSPLQLPRDLSTRQPSPPTRRDERDMRIEALVNSSPQRPDLPSWQIAEKEQFGQLTATFEALETTRRRKRSQSEISSEDIAVTTMPVRDNDQRMEDADMAGPASRRLS